jgi:hypothetical protein
MHHMMHQKHTCHHATTTLNSDAFFTIGQGQHTTENRIQPPGGKEGPTKWVPLQGMCCNTTRDLKTDPGTQQATELLPIARPFEEKCRKQDASTKWGASAGRVLPNSTCLRPALTQAHSKPLNHYRSQGLLEARGANRVGASAGRVLPNSTCLRPALTQAHSRTLN